MDPVTHVLSGVLAARATAPQSPRPGQLPLRARLATAALASALPDADFFLRFFDPLFYLVYHRSLLNSVLLWPLWSIGLALLLAALTRQRYGWRAFAGVCLLAWGLHIFMDLITSFGSLIFSPFSFVRVAWPSTFIIDPWFTAIIGAGLIASYIWRERRRPAALALAVLAGYIGLQSVLYERALAVARAYVSANALAGAEVYALPQPFSPFNWMSVAVQADSYHFAYISLWRRTVSATPPGAGMLRAIYHSYRPVDQAEWRKLDRFGDAPDAELARAVWEHPEMRLYRQFALLPALHRIDNDSGTCVWFRDLRFALVGRGPVFPFGLCREHEQAPWRLHRLTDGLQPEAIAP